MHTRKVYLGDGVYAEYDGEGIMCTTENGVTVTNRIYFDPSTMNGLLMFLDKLKQEASHGPIDHHIRS